MRVSFPPMKERGIFALETTKRVDICPVVVKVSRMQFAASFWDAHKGPSLRRYRTASREVSWDPRRRPSEPCVDAPKVRYDRPFSRSQLFPFLGRKAGCRVQWNLPPDFFRLLGIDVGIEHEKIEKRARASGKAIFPEGPC